LCRVWLSDKSFYIAIIESVGLALSREILLDIYILYTAPSAVHALVMRSSKKDDDE
jgi:hypothetical protein